MAETSVLSSLKELINDEVFIDKAQDLARLFYSNSFLTIDLYVYLAWGTAIAAVLLLMFLLFGDESKLGGISSGYGTALSKSYDTEDAIIELQQQVYDVKLFIFFQNTLRLLCYSIFPNISCLDL